MGVTWVMSHMSVLRICLVVMGHVRYDSVFIGQDLCVGAVESSAGAVIGVMCVFYET